MKKTESVLKADMLSAETKRVAKGHQLRIKLKSGGQATFEGFKSDEMNQILEFFKTNYGIEIKIVELSLKGHNSGIPKFHDTFLSFDIDGKPAFELPLNVVKSASAQKFEANVDFLVVRSFVSALCRNNNRISTRMSPFLKLSSRHTLILNDYIYRTPKKMMNYNR